MRTFRRRSITGRAAVIAAAIGVLAAVALPGAGAAVARPGGNAAVAQPGGNAATTPSPSPSASSTASTSHTKCVTTGLGATCTGTYSGDKAYNPWTAPPGGTGTQISQPPVVTVSQTKDLTDQVVNVNWQYFTPSLATPGTPNPVGTAAYYRVTIYECKGTNPTVDASGLFNSCYEQTLGSTQSQAGVPNAQVNQPTFAPGATGNAFFRLGTGGDPANWKGQAQFHIEAGAQENSMLGCDASTPCSLAIVPNFGGNFNPNQSVRETDTTNCENHSNDHGFFTKNAANSFACGLMDRIIVPLSFARTASNCPQNNYQFYAEGSPMTSRAMTQWQGGWCTGAAPVNIHYGSGTAEYQARNDFLQGAQALSAPIDMAIVTLPPDPGAASSRKFTYAPLANTGVAMAYYLDDALTGRPVNRVVLNPRLAAKLTTESYSLSYDCKVPPPSPWPPPPNPSETCDPAVLNNPHTLFDDQEFLSLNKNCQPTGTTNYVCGASDFPNDLNSNFQAQQGAFLPTVLGGSSDMTYQLTDWVGANTAGAGFLGGLTDPWGMHVNNNYWKTSYPTQFFQTLDQGTSYPNPPSTCVQNCSNIASEVNATTNAAWNPQTPLVNIANDLLGFQPTAYSPYKVCPSGVSCSVPGEMGWAFLPPTPVGGRDLFSEMDLSDVSSYQFPATAMVNAAGTAVTPSQGSVLAAVKDMKTNPDGITQYANQSSTDKAAYPLAMVNYAMVPTCGLSSSKASAIANFLDKAATTGQIQGNVPGDLAPGYYPLTSAQRAQTLKAAQDVRTQDCKSAPKDTTISGHPAVNDTSSPKGSNPSGSGQPGTNPSATSPNGKSGKPLSSAKGPAGGTPTGKAQTAAFGRKSGDSGLTGLLLLLAIIVGALLLVGGPAAWALTATGKWPVVLRWLRPVQARLGAAKAWLTGLAVRRA